jgi:hypothetical protein
MAYTRKIKNIEVNPPQNNALGTTVTGTLSETITQSVLIPANTFKQFDIFGIEARLRKQNTNGIVTLRLRIGSGNTISSSYQVAISSGTSANSFIPITRRAIIKNLTTSTQFVSTGTTLATDILMDNQGYSLIPINWQIDNFLLLTAQLGSTLDIANGTGLVIDCPQAE